jgi:hypothetical protein
VDGHDRVLAVELAREHRADLARLHVALERLQPFSQVGFDVLALPRPVDQDGQVVGLAAQRRRQRAIVFEAPAALQQLLRRSLVLPEVRSGDLRLDVLDLARQPRVVKGPSGDEERAR